MMRFLILVAFVLVFVSCSAEVERPLQPIRPTPTLGASVTGQAVEITFEKLNEAPDNYLNRLLRVTGNYAPLPYPPLCKHYVGPRPTWSMIGDGLQMSAIGYETITSLLKEGDSVTLDGVWRLYYGPMGCGKEPATQFLWYLDVRRIVQPNPLVMGSSSDAEQPPVMLPTEPPVATPTESVQLTQTATITSEEQPTQEPEVTPTVEVVAPTIAPITQPSAEAYPASDQSQPSLPTESAVTLDTPILQATPTELPPPSEEIPTELPPPSEEIPTELPPSAEIPTELPPPSEEIPTELPPSAEIPTELPPPTEIPVVEETPISSEPIDPTETPLPTEDRNSGVKPTPTLGGIELVSPTPQIKTPTQDTESVEPTETPDSAAESTPTPTSIPTTEIETEETPSSTPTPELSPTEESDGSLAATSTPETTTEYIDEVTPTSESDSPSQSATETPIPPDLFVPETTEGYPSTQATPINAYP